MTVILTTHDMDDIEALCTRVMVIGRGRILSDGNLEALRARVTTKRRLIVDLIEENQSIDDPDVQVIQQDGHRIHLEFDPNQVPAPILISRITARYAIRDLFVENPPIEEIISRLYNEHEL